MATSALFTDLYELTMAQAYDAEGFEDLAVFELFFRKMPEKRNFVMAAGLEDVLDFLENFNVTEDDIDYLRQQGQFSERFLTRLKNTHFTGDVLAVPEGTVVFPNEPIVQVIAPIFEAQLVETLILNQIHFQSIAASKAARLHLSAPGKNIVDFGSRRAHGTDAALKVARATYIAGCAGTSNVLAGKMYGIPIFGTMAHSYIQAHDVEYDAFKNFASIFPNTTILVDTYDSISGIKKVIQLLKEEPDINVRAVRLDSGDLLELSKKTRKMLDDAGHSSIKIFASSSLDEYALHDLLQNGAPIDGFGVGTKLAVSNDVPYLDFAYKLVEYAGKGKTKLSSEKIIYPGRKQIYRLVEDGKMKKDVITKFDTAFNGAQALLQPVMRHGKRLITDVSSVEMARETAKKNIEILPDSCKSLKKTDVPYEIEIHESLQKHLSDSKRELQEKEIVQN